MSWQQSPEASKLPPCHGQNAQQNTEQRKNQRRKRQLSFKFHYKHLKGKKKKIKEVGGEAASSKKKLWLWGFWGQINQNAKTSSRLGIFAVSIREVTPKAGFECFKLHHICQQNSAPAAPWAFLWDWGSWTIPVRVGVLQGWEQLSIIQLLVPHFPS